MLLVVKNALHGHLFAYNPNNGDGHIFIYNPNHRDGYIFVYNPNVILSSLCQKKKGKNIMPDISLTVSFFYYPIPCLTLIFLVRLRAAGKSNAEVRKTRSRDRAVRAMPAPEANAELQTNLDVCQISWPLLSFIIFQLTNELPPLTCACYFLR